MGRLHLCEECAGTGAIAFDSGPAAENCRRCSGVGVLMLGEGSILGELRKLFSVTQSDEGLLTQAAPGAEWRLLLLALTSLEDRLTAIERELAR